MLIETDDYIDAGEAARLLDVSRARVSQLCKEGRFDGLARIGRFWVMPREAVENFERLPLGGQEKYIKEKKKLKSKIAELEQKIKELEDEK